MENNFKCLSNKPATNAGSPFLKNKFHKLTLSTVSKKGIKKETEPLEYRPQLSAKTLVFELSSSEDERNQSDNEKIIEKTVVNKALQSSSSQDVPNLETGRFEKLELSDSDVTSCSNVVDDEPIAIVAHDEQLQTQMEKLEISASNVQSEDLFSRDTLSDGRYSNMIPKMIIDKLSEKVSSMELNAEVANKNCSVISLSSANDSLYEDDAKDNSNKTDTLSSIPDNEVLDIISISDSDADELDESIPDNVSSMNTAKNIELSETVAKKLDNFFNNIPLLSTQCLNNRNVNNSLGNHSDSNNSLAYVSETTEERSEDLNDSLYKRRKKPNHSPMYISATSEELEDDIKDGPIEDGNVQFSNKPCSLVLQSQPLTNLQEENKQLSQSLKKSQSDLANLQQNIIRNSPTINISAKFNIKIQLNTSSGSTSSSSSSSSSKSNNQTCVEPRRKLTPKSTGKTQEKTSTPKIPISINTHQSTSKASVERPTIKSASKAVDRTTPRKQTTKDVDKINRSPASKAVDRTTLRKQTPKDVDKISRSPASKAVDRTTLRKQTPKDVDKISRAPASKLYTNQAVPSKAIENLQKPDDSRLFQTPKNRKINLTRLKVPSKEPTVDEDDDCKHLLNARNQALLDQIYGVDKWKTPVLIKKMERIAKCQTEIKPKPKTNDLRYSNNFSIFQRDIKCDLESTRIQPSENHPLQASEAINKNVRVNNSSVVTSPFFKKPTDTKKQLSPVMDTECANTRIKRKARKPVINNDSSDNTDDDSESSEEWQDDKKSTSSSSYKSSKSTVSRKKKSDDNLVYLDLTHAEVRKDELHVDPNASEKDLEEISRQFIESLSSNDSRNENDEFDILTTKKPTKRKLFTPNHFKLLDYEADVLDEDHKRLNIVDETKEEPQEPSVHLKYPMPTFLMPHYKPVTFFETPPKSVKKIETPKSLKKILHEANTIESGKKNKNHALLATPTGNTYNFLQSMDACIPIKLCHPEVVLFKNNFKLRKTELAEKLYSIYNEKIFENKINVPITWNNRLRSTSGICRNSKRSGVRVCSIQLSDKVVTSCDRLRCTLIHELCHAAAWIFDGQSGHGETWKKWAQKSMKTFPELPKIAVCHAYDIEYKFTYKCTICGSQSRTHSRAKKVENIRCSCCHGSIELFHNKKDKHGNIELVPVKRAGAFANFVKENFKKYKTENMKMADVMRLLGQKFKVLSTIEKSKYM